MIGEGFIKIKNGELNITDQNHKVNYAFGLVIDTIKPEWFRREVVRSIASGASIILVANKGKIKLFGYPIMDVKDNQ